jgi:hypothetical protein
MDGLAVAMMIVVAFWPGQPPVVVAKSWMNHERVGPAEFVCFQTAGREKQKRRELENGGRTERTERSTLWYAGWRGKGRWKIFVHLSKEAGAARAQSELTTGIGESLIRGLLFAENWISKSKQTEEM